MNAQEIKEKRKILGFTQKQLAELIGVSFQTINGYENGKEIPSTKYQILDTVLNPKTDVLNEPVDNYINISSNELSEIQEEITQRRKIITLSKDLKQKQFQQKIVDLLEEQIRLIKQQRTDDNLDK